MEFKLDTQLLNQNILKNGKAENNAGNRIKLFPFPANETQLKDDVKADLKDFRGIAAACIRESLGISPKNAFDKAEFITKICAKANAPGNTDLERIVKKLVFNQNGHLELFDLLVYPHLHHPNSVDNKTLKEIARYIVAIFFDAQDKETIAALVQAKPDNLFYKLVLSCLPDTHPASVDPEQYYHGAAKLKGQFRADLKVLTSDPDLFLTGFHQLLRYYFFKYVSDLAASLNAFFGPVKGTLFFSLKWERMQDYRQAMRSGWSNLEHHLRDMFSHAMTLEIINHIDGLGTVPLTYADLARTASSLSEEEKACLVAQIQEATALYIQNQPKLPWHNFDANKPLSEDPLENVVKQLFQAVEFQFNNSSKYRAKQAYANWMYEFTKPNFAKRRGILGYSLSLDSDLLLLLTRICVGDEEKIRLKELWEGLETRGIYLDSLSKDQVITYFEKVNLLEKKSDSGDAQYIRKFSQTSL